MVIKTTNKNLVLLTFIIQESHVYHKHLEFVDYE